MHLFTPSDSDVNQRSGGYELDELTKQLYRLNPRELCWSWPVFNPVTQDRTEAQRASVRVIGSGGWTRPSPRPAHRGRAGVRASLPKLQAGGNQRPPGYKPSPCRGSLGRQFHSFEGAPYGCARLSPARFAPENMHQLTSRSPQVKTDLGLSTLKTDSPTR
jgi:hypothetical protein